MILYSILPYMLRRRILYIRKILYLLIPLALVLINPAFADELRSNDGVDETVPAVRYWKPVALDGIPIRTIDPSIRASTIPERNNPKPFVVMYHNLVYGRTGNSYNRDIYNFEHDIEFLLRNFAIIDFKELDSLVSGEKNTTTDVAIITFDDGDLSMYAIAYPLLKELDIKATFFIVPDYVGEIGYMSWDQIREMASYRNALGQKLFSFGSHTLSHQPLGELVFEDVTRELAVSKYLIEQELGEEVDVLALPFGSGAQNEHVLNAAVSAGYRMIRTSVPLAIPLASLDMLHIPAFNVENYSSDMFVTNAMRLIGR